ncbi:MAG: hypothetical protein R6W78_16735 [Bacteroidales bacterium]
MKDSLFVSTGLMVAIWVPVHYAFHLPYAYILLIIALVILFIRIGFSKRLNRY